jgi:peptidoglycan glycosyltransferase
LNAQIIKLFGLFVVLFALLIGFTSWWSVLDADTQKERSSNRRALIEEQTVPRGLIYARDGRTVLAKNVAHGPQEDTPRARNLRTFTRTYPEGPLFGHAVGYSFLRNGRKGLEESENRPLAGEENEFQSIFSQLRSQSREGRDVVTTLDPDAQKEALNQLAGKQGAIVALEPQTGRVRVMASTPTYDPNQVPTQFGRLNADEGRPLNNRVTQERYSPGSTFKVVTAAAALDSGKATPDSTFDGSSPQTISGSPLSNFGGENFGPVSFTEALTNSVNTVFARVGERVGRRTLIRYMDRFGFGQDPPLDYPDDQMIPSGVIVKGRTVTGSQAFDVGRVAIGQGGLEGQIQATPIQMAMVASAVGNRGKLMRPTLVERIVAKDGRVTSRVKPALQSRVISPKAASELGGMMKQVVKEGTGTAAALSGVEVAGKTGTAETGQFNQPWFIAFAPADNPKMAIAVTLEKQPSGATGGQTAAPLAKSVLQKLLGSGAGA